MNYVNHDECGGCVKVSTLIFCHNDEGKGDPADVLLMYNPLLHELCKS